MGGHGGNSDYEDKHAGYGWLLFCASGMITTLTMYGIVLEYVTSGGRKLHEVSFIFVTTTIYAITAYIARGIFNENVSNDISRYNLLVLSLTSISSTFTSVRSLRYVIYPVQILFKSCKPVPVMLFGLFFGKRYSTRKYVNVIIITAGVALFMGGGNSTTQPGSSTSGTTIIGGLMLSVSLCFDGLTGAYEDKLMSGDNQMGPYDLMFNIQFGKSLISFCTLMATNGLNDFFTTINSGGISLIILGITGALGQIFLFITISKFGALNCALLGLFRKMLSLVLSFVLYGHTLNAIQTVGLALSIIAMLANFYEKGGKSPDGADKVKTDESANKKKNECEEDEYCEENPLLVSDEETEVVKKQLNSNEIELSNIRSSLKVEKPVDLMNV